METTTTQVLAAEVYDEEYDYRDEEPFYYCAYCNADRGRDSMEMMCADCFWEHDSLRKRPGRIRYSLVNPKYESPEGQERVLRWIREANEELAEFEEKLEAGQDRIHRELEIHEVYGEAHPVGAGTAEESKPKPKPKTLEEMTDDELQGELIILDNERKEMRYKARDREMTPEEREEYAAKEKATDVRVEELLRRRQ
jgi:hypothetical protein